MSFELEDVCLAGPLRVAANLRNTATPTWNKICGELLMQNLLPLQLRRSEQGMSGDD
jgi:hypothetical protein